MTPGAQRLRYALIALLGLGAILSAVGNTLGSRLASSLAIAAFFAAVILYAGWRRETARRRRASVFDREAKTDETRTRPDE